MKDFAVTRPASRFALTNLEIPTLFVAVAIHGGWLALTYWHGVLPWPILALFGGAIVAWHGSLQHETIHGHPTGMRWIDTALGSVALSLWLPYGSYRRSHLGHHAAPAITDPLGDPESNYVTGREGVGLRLANLEASLIGRLVLGPPIRLLRFLVAEMSHGYRQPAEVAADWLLHGLGVIPVLWWLHWVELSPAEYLLLFVYPGTSISLLRSFAEHRADDDPKRRAAIIDRPGILGLLFLNNNLHAVHHAWPTLAWYDLPDRYRRDRAVFAAAPRYRTYGQVVRRFALQAHDGAVHPDHRVRSSLP